MNKEFIPYEQALELKELGLLTYKKDNDFGLLYKGSDIPSILYQQAFRWFREKYELRISNYRCSIKKEDGIVIGDGFRIFKYGKDTISTIEKETYEEAELACLKKLIEIVKNK
jgi:hypothetical protein